MQLCGPALGGFLFTLAATALLAVVSFSVPWFKSVYFLRAAISQSGVSGSVTFGVLGYCLDFNNQVSCSKPSVGWEFNPNELLGNDLPIQIPNVVVKWITYALVLHIVALGLSGVSAVFGLLAQVRTTTMSCFSSCVAGTAAAVALIAFIFDLVLFFAVRARVNNVQGGSASIGNALWMTLAAWALLFFSGCAYAFGRCCGSRMPSGSKGSGRRSRKDSVQSERTDDGGKYDRESERMRLDAVKAEADRKARQREGRQEVGLPAFYEYERTPLRREEPQYYEEEVEVVVPYTDRREPSRASQRTQASGPAGYRPNRNYEPGAPGTRAIDDYYNNTAPTAASLAAANTYPPKPQQRQRQASQQSQRQASIGQAHRQASTHSATYDPYVQTRQNVPPVPTVPQTYQQSPPNRPVDPYAATSQPQSRVDPYLAIAGAVGGAAATAAYANNNRGYDSDPYSHQQYPSSSHQQYPSATQQYTQNQGHQDPYSNSSYNPQAAAMSPPQPTHYLDNSNSGYQGYGGQQQQGYDPYEQQRDAYGGQQQQRDPYPHDPYAQQQGYDNYGQQGYDSYNQQGYDSYANQGYSPQQAYSSVVPVAQPQPVPAVMPQPEVREPEPEPRTMVASPQRGLVASPSPMASPSYTPQPPQNIDTTATVVAGPSSGQGHQHNWSVTRSEESPSEAPPPQYEATPGAAAAYPVEKR